VFFYFQFIFLDESKLAKHEAFSEKKHFQFKKKDVVNECEVITG
jgi:hypothetical protein